MCGIAGFVGRGDLADLRRMNAAQRHRGPDGEGTYVDPAHAVHLGHQRLAVIDLAGGHQPMWTADNQLGIVFNGEIYNHGELRGELTALGSVFQTDHSDTEVLLHAYRQWGEDFVKRLNGMWAFVIYDRQQRRLFGSRDRFGKKPFYYHVGPNLFAFASELTALTAHSHVPRKVSPLGLKKLFAYGYIPAPHTYIGDTWKIPAGHNFSYDLREWRLTVRPYWEFRLQPDPSWESRRTEDLGEELLAILSRAVQRRLIADVPIGTFLSGGVDSSTITMLAANLAGSQAIETFSVGFDEPSFDESRYARLVADHIGARHHHQVFTDAEARAALPQVAGGLDEPLGDSSILPTWFLARFARRNVTVALGGDGADELFAGYDPFRAIRWANLYQKLLPRPVHRAIALVAHHLPVSHRNMSLDFKIKRTLRGLDYPPALWCPVWMAPLAPNELSALFNEPIAPEEIYADAITAWEQCSQPDSVSHVLEFYTRFYLQDDILTKVDRASMAHSLEVRSPFLDLEVAEFAQRLPVAFKLRGTHTKSILKEAVRGHLPREIIDRPKKGFGVPIGRWYQKQELPIADCLPDMLDTNFYHLRANLHLQGKADERSMLWLSTLITTPSAIASQV